MLKFLKRRRLRRVGVLPGREALARKLFSDKVQDSRLDLLDYDNSPRLQRVWALEADRRLEHAASPDRHVAAHHGIPDAEWIHLPAIVQRDHRESFYQAKGL